MPDWVLVIKVESMGVTVKFILLYLISLFHRMHEGWWLNLIDTMRLLTLKYKCMRNLDLIQLGMNGNICRNNFSN